MKIEKLTITYHNGNAPAIHEMSFQVPERSVLCVVGESGSGKSTLIRSITGLNQNEGMKVTGKILFKGENLLTISNTEMRNIRGKQISMIFQNAGRYLDGRRTIGYQFAEAIQSHENVSKGEALKMAEEILVRLSLPNPGHILDSYPFELSGGMCQRVAIAMAMVLKPQLLLADEPTSALDVTIQTQVVRMMMELREQYHTTIVMVTHNLGIASYMADYIAVLKDGELVEFGRRDQIINEPKMEYTKQMLSAVPKFQTIENREGQRNEG